MNYLKFLKKLEDEVLNNSNSNFTKDDVLLMSNLFNKVPEKTLLKIIKEHDNMIQSALGQMKSQLKSQ